MQAFRACRPRRALLGIAALSMSLLVSPSPGDRAYAQIGPCESDPVVVLSDGTTLDLSAAISDAESDVQSVSYSLTIPSGTSVVSVTNTYGPLGPKEVFSYSAGNAARTYSSTTVVYTGSSQIPVTVMTEAVDAPSVQSASASGLNKQKLFVSVSL